MFAQSVGILISLSLIFQATLSPHCPCGDRVRVSRGTLNSCGAGSARPCCCQRGGTCNRCSSAPIPNEVPPKACCKIVKNAAAGKTSMRASALQRETAVRTTTLSACDCVCLAAAHNGASDRSKASTLSTWRELVSLLIVSADSLYSPVFIGSCPRHMPASPVPLQVVTALERCISLGRLLT